MSLLTHVVKAFPSCGTLHIAEVDVGVVGSVHAPAPPPKLASTPHQQPKQQTAAAARKMPLVPVNHFQQFYSHYLSICGLCATASAAFCLIECTVIGQLVRALALAASVCLLTTPPPLSAAVAAAAPAFSAP